MGGGVGRRGAPEGCAGGVCHSPVEGAAACPGRPPMWAEGCDGGVCHNPCRGVRRRGCAGGVPLLEAAACPGRSPRWAEGGVLEGCTGGWYIGCRLFLCKEVLLLGAAACCCLDVGGDWLSTWEPSQLVWWLLERSPEEGAGSVYRWYGGFQRWCSHAAARNPIILLLRFPNFQMSGKIPSFSERLNTVQSGFAITAAIFIIILLLIISGPESFIWV